MNTFESEGPTEDDDPMDTAHEMLEEELKEIFACVGKKEPVVGVSFPEVTDMSERFSKDAELVRVELRRCRDKLSGKTNPTNKIVEGCPIVGIIPISDFPEEGEIFQMFYHGYDGLLRFGHVTSFVPIYGVQVADGHHFFTADGVDWRLSKIDSGN